MNPRDRQTRSAAGLSLGYNIAVTVAKVVAATLTGSVSLISESVHSATDVVASIIALISVRAAAVPPDEDHPYGHGKIETLAGFGESIFLLQLVVYIVFEASQRLVHNTKIENVGVGLWVMAASATGGLLVGRTVSHIGKATHSGALQSNGQHLMLDFWTSAGVFAALVVTKLTGWVWADSAFAYVLAIGIARSAWKMATTAFQQLIDRTLPEDELGSVHRVLREDPDVISYHRLRARHSGHSHYVDVHVVVPREWSAVQAHELADRVEKKINSVIEPAITVVHVDPYDPAKARVKT